MRLLRQLPDNLPCSSHPPHRTVKLTVIAACPPRQAQALTECASFILFFSFRLSFSIVRNEQLCPESPPLSIVLFHFCYFLFFRKKPRSQTLFPELSTFYQQSRTEF